MLHSGEGVKKLDSKIQEIVASVYKQLAYLFACKRDFKNTETAFGICESILKQIYMND